MNGKITPVDKAVYEGLSNDHKYLHDICLAVQGGWRGLTTKLAQKFPGKVHQARWVTTANTILRLYVQEHTPSYELNRLAGYLVNVYAPSFFKIKTDYQVF